MNTTLAPPQLSFDVGGEAPDIAILRVSGGLAMSRELGKGEEVHVQVSNADGEIIADGYGRISQVAFKDRVDEVGQVTGADRIHTAKVS